MSRDLTFEQKAAELRIASKVVKLAEDKLRARLQELFPPGAPVTWKRGYHVQSGTVDCIHYRDRMTVTNGRTGKTIQISSFEIIEASEAQS